MTGRFVVNVCETDDCGNTLDVDVTVDVDGTQVTVEWDDEWDTFETIREFDRPRLETEVHDSVFSYYTERSFN